MQTITIKDYGMAGTGTPTSRLRWYIPKGAPAEYPPILQQCWVIRTPDGKVIEEWEAIPLVRGE